MKLRYLLPLLCVLPLSKASATTFTVNPSLTNTSPIAYETSGVPNGATVQFSLDVGGQVDVNIYQLGSDGVSLTQIANVERFYSTGGAQQIFWNALWYIGGTDTGRHDGNYQFQVIASSAGTSNTFIIPGFIAITSIDIHSVTVAPTLDANGNEEFPYLVSYALAKDANVTINVLNSSGTVVSSLLNNQLELGEASISTHTVTWGGLGTNGKPVPFGIYTFTLDAVDPTNNDHAIERVRTLGVTTVPANNTDFVANFAQNVFVYPNPVRNGQGTFVFTPGRDGSTIHLKVYTIVGDEVLSEDFPSLSAGETTQYVWNVTNQSGKKVGRGLYYYVVREDDPQGTLQTVKKLAVIQ